MLNIAIPMAGPNPFDKDEYQYPAPLIEINGKPMIEHVVDCLEQIRQEKRFIFIVKKCDCKAYHLDSVLRLITNQDSVIIQLRMPARGAVCSVLMAIEHIDNGTPLIISNSNHVIDYDLDRIVTQFQERKLDAGTICFDSVHPKWSFVRLDEDGRIVETAEKRPLSRNAIAGFYYFHQGSDFVRSAMKMIEKDVNVEGNYYVSTVINELVLGDKNLGIFKIPSGAYCNFYSPHKIKEYEARTKQSLGSIEDIYETA